MDFFKKDVAWVKMLREEWPRQEQKRLDEFDYHISQCIYCYLRQNPSLLEHEDVHFLWQYARGQLFGQYQKSLQGLNDAEKERFLNLLFDAKEKYEGEKFWDYSGCVAWCLALLEAYRGMG